jgi:ribosomal protein S18 acetylase RimI-like enzyme
MTSIGLRPAVADDAVAIAALAVQVFLDTYATHGVRPDLAREAFHGYSVEAFQQRLAQPHRKFVVAERGTALIGFMEAQCERHDAPAPGVAGAELVRLYIQPRSQRSGIGRLLLEKAEQIATELGHPALWLTVWDGNRRAIAFYETMGYRDVGETLYAFEGNSYGNRVMAKTLP